MQMLIIVIARVL